MPFLVPYHRSHQGQYKQHGNLDHHDNLRGVNLNHLLDFGIREFHLLKQGASSFSILLPLNSDFAFSGVLAHTLAVKQRIYVEGQ